MTDGVVPVLHQGAARRGLHASREEEGVSAYVVLCETFARLCEREVGLEGAGTREEVGVGEVGFDPGIVGTRSGVGVGEVGFDPGTVGSVSVRADPGVCSPVNCFITVAKGAGGACGAC